MNHVKGVRVSREELHEQVWQTPMAKLAAQYGLSGNGLAKICRKLKIPYPGRGYWARKAAGKHVIQYQLQPPDPDTPAVILITPYQKKVDLQPSEATQTALDAERESITELSVPNRLSSPHPVIKSWGDTYKEEQQRARKDPYGYFGSVKTLTSIDRRCHRILNTLFKALEKKGFTEVDPKFWTGR